MNNLLLRELPLNATIRLWDTYLSEPDGFNKFHLYVCAAFLCRWKQDLEQKKDFQNILLFIQNVPTAKWHDKVGGGVVWCGLDIFWYFSDVREIISEIINLISPVIIPLFLCWTAGIQTIFTDKVV